MNIKADINKIRATLSCTDFANVMLCLFTSPPRKRL